MKKTSLMAASASAVVFLAGCSSEDPAETPATSNVAPTQTEASEPVEEQPGEETSRQAEEPGSGTSGSGPQYSAAALKAALVTVNEAESLQGTIVSDAELRPLLEEAEDSNGLADIVITPPECNVFAENSTVDLAADANLALMTFAGGSSLQPDSLNLASQTSSDIIAQQIDLNRRQLENCSEFQLEISGEQISATVTELEAMTDADKTFAVSTEIQAPGSLQQSISVTGISGTTNINVMVGSSGDQEADLERAVNLVNAAVAALENS